jgi:hypothetical protein
MNMDALLQFGNARVVTKIRRSTQALHATFRPTGRWVNTNLDAKIARVHDDRRGGAVLPFQEPAGPADREAKGQGEGLRASRRHGSVHVEAGGYR